MYLSLWLGTLHLPPAHTHSLSCSSLFPPPSYFTLPSPNVFLNPLFFPLPYPSSSILRSSVLLNPSPSPDLPLPCSPLLRSPFRFPPLASPLPPVSCLLHPHSSLPVPSAPPSTSRFSCSCGVRQARLCIRDDQQHGEYPRRKQRQVRRSLAQIVHEATRRMIEQIVRVPNTIPPGQAC